MTTSSELLDVIRQYLAALEQMETGDKLARFFSPTVVQEEFPNRLVPNGARRDLAALLEGAVRGKQIMATQRYELLTALVDDDCVAIEVQWSGTLAVPAGTLTAGDQMRARFAVFFEFQSGKIVRQRNYDCFEPW